MSTLDEKDDSYYFTLSRVLAGMTLPFKRSWFVAINFRLLFYLISIEEDEMSLEEDDISDGVMV